MANASLQPIYERINGVNNYHPYTADTFADWSLEAGDIVAVSQDGKVYQSPVHKTTLTWTGKQRIELESHGEKERAPLSKMSADAYNSGNGGANGYRGGYRSGKRDKDFYTDIYNNQEAIRLEAVDRREADNQMEAAISITAGEIKAEVKRYTDDKSRELGARLDVQAGLIDMVVYEDSGGKHIRGGRIALAINNGGSEAVIEASHIRLSGTTNLNDVLTVDGQAVRINRRLYVGGGGSVTAIYPTFITTDAILCNNQRLKVADATVSGNTLTITYVDGSKANFSKATTLSGKWSGGNTWTVTASPQGNKDIIRIGNKDRNTIGIARPGAETWLGTFVHGQYDAGYDAGYAAGGGGHNITAGTLYVETRTPSSSYTRIGNGAVRVASLSSGNTYLRFSMSCGGSSKTFYIILQK